MGRVRSYYAIALVGLCVAYFRSQAALREAMGDQYSDMADRVTVSNSEHQDALALLFAAKKAIQERRIEDAGVYFYAAQIRSRVDVSVYEPVGVGGNSPVALFAAMEETLGAPINALVMRDRDAYARAIARLANWTPAFDADYRPGWEYKTRLTGPARNAAVKEVKEPRLAQMQALNQLLQIDEYYDAFKTVQDYNFGDGFSEAALNDSALPEAEARVSAEECQAAIDRLKQIEQQRGIKPGLFPDKEALKRARKTKYAILESGVTFGRQKVLGADPRTFEVLPDVDYGKDARHVYVYGCEIPGADPQTFRVLEPPYARDKSAVFCGNIAMNNERIEDFEVVRSSSMWSVGPNNVVSSYGWSRDRKNYYFGPNVVKDADYGSFRVINDYYAEDTNRGYKGQRPVEKGSIPVWARRPQ